MSQHPDNPLKDPHPPQSCQLPPFWPLETPHRGFKALGGPQNPPESVMTQLWTLDPLGVTGGAQEMQKMGRARADCQCHEVEGC